MSSEGSLLPGSNARGPNPFNRVTTLLRRKPLLWIAVALNAIVIIYYEASSMERFRSEQVWRDEATTWLPAAVSERKLLNKPKTKFPAHLIGEASTPEELKCSQQWQSESGDEATFSLENETEKGRIRRESLQDMVSKCKGYYVRDYPLWLGWNNIRYIIETSLLHAELLDRVLVVPTYVYARACEFDKRTCHAFAKMVNRGDALESDEWRHEPIDKQWAWLIPIELMIDINLIRQTRPIMTVADYLLLHDLSADLERAKGDWDREAYQSVSFHVIPNSDYDTNISRVDKMPPGWQNVTDEDKTSGLGAKIREVMGADLVKDWDDIKSLVGSGQSDEALVQELETVGAYALYTWQGALGMELTRTVTDPIMQVSLGERMKGWQDDYRNVDEEVLLLVGETHHGQKPGSLRFTSEHEREGFARMVLFDIMPPPMLVALAVRLDNRMHDKVGGRMWASAHMRRGDFVHHGWAMHQNAYEHFARIRSRMRKGQMILRHIKYFGRIEHYPGLKIAPAEDFTLFQAPEIGDPFYVATDERNSSVIEHMKKGGAIFFDDLITAEDRREMAAWPLMFTDVVGVLEQALLARSSYFYGHAMSSVAGGVVNQRATLGKDPRTAMID